MARAQLMYRFERDANSVLTDTEDVEALNDMIREWKRLGSRSMKKLAMG